MKAMEHDRVMLPVLCGEARGVEGTDFQRGLFDNLIPASSDALVSATVWAAGPHGRREIMYLSATALPSAEWTSRQLTEAFGWEAGPCYLVRDVDSVYGEVFTGRLRAMGIRDRPTAPRSPWQNGYCERLIGSIRRARLDHVVVLAESHLRDLLRSCQKYYNECRTHLSLGKDAPLSRAVQVHGRIAISPVLGGLHHQYCRV